MSELIIVYLDRFVITLIIVYIVYYPLNLKSICRYAIAVTVIVYHWPKLNNTRTLSSCAVYTNMFKLIPPVFIIFYNFFYICCYVILLILL